MINKHIERQMFIFHQHLRSVVVWLHLFTNVAKQALVKACKLLKKKKRVVTEQRAHVCKYVHANAITHGELTHLH